MRGGVAAVSARRLPPIAEIAVGSMIFAIAGAIYIASYLPRHAPLAPAVALMAVSGGLLLVNGVVLARVGEFAWHTFFLVARWTLIGYAVIAGMLEYVFVYDHTRGSILVLMTLTLAVFAVDVPVILGFSVARYQPPDRR